MRTEFAGFLAYLEFSQKRSQRTKEIYSQILNDFEEFLGGRELSEENARSYLRSRAAVVQASTQSLSVSVLRSLNRWLRVEGFPSLWQLKSPRIVQKKIRVFAEEDLDLLLDVIAKKNLEEQILFHLLYGSALRISEALMLQSKDIDLKKSNARVLGKGSRWREVPLTQICVELLKELKNKEGSWHANSINYACARRWTGQWGEEAGIQKKYGALHPHLLRHALASHLLRRGAKLPHIQKLLGHQRLATTEKYTHLELDDLIRAYDKAMPKKST